ncbi:hypothetical protein MMC17_005634 [Xylographa soralifera]|nr:hypothetical protein [Xylographa soralifera]
MSLQHLAQRGSYPQKLNYICQQCRHASLLRRPKRPYTFTQLVTLSDGSSYLQRTTSPIPIYKSTKDRRNTPLWNPSSQKLMNFEADEAGRLRAFRERFGRGWDARTNVEEEESDEAGGEDGEDVQEQNGSLMDLISGYGQDAEKQGTAKAVREEKEKSRKGTSGER